MSKEIAAAILQQLGGRRFVAMVGPKHLVAHRASPGIRGALQIDLPRRLGRDKVTRVMVKLTVMDLYTVESWRIDARRLVPEAVRLQVREEVYAEDLPGVFHELTGLYTRLQAP